MRGDVSPARLALLADLPEGEYTALTSPPLGDDAGGKGAFHSGPVLTI
jgi:hypothetical protein